MGQLRYVILAALFLAPIASAGVSVSADVLPASTSKCGEWESEYSWNGSSEWNGTTYSWFYGSRSEGRDCESNTDTARASVSANDANVASVRSGEGHHESGSSQSDYYTSFERDGETGERFGWSSYQAGGHHEWSDIHETSATTDLASARAVDGCRGGSSYRYEGWGSGVWSPATDDSPSEAHGSGSSWGSSSSTSQCEQSATVASGVTTLRGGHDSGCRDSYREEGTWSYDSAGADDTSGNDTNGNGTPEFEWFSTGSGASDCSDEYGASAGSERVSAGSRRHCDQTSQRHDANDDGAWTSSSTYQDECTDELGVWGPTDLAVTRRDAWSSYGECWYEEGEEYSCISWADYGDRSLVVSQRYVGSTGVPLP